MPPGLLEGVSTVATTRTSTVLSLAWMPWIKFLSGRTCILLWILYGNVVDFSFIVSLYVSDLPSYRLYVSDLPKKEKNYDYPGLLISNTARYSTVQVRITVQYCTVGPPVAHPAKYGDQPYLLVTLGKSETYKETMKEKSTILPYSIHKRIHVRPLRNLIQGIHVNVNTIQSTVLKVDQPYSYSYPILVRV